MSVRSNIEFELLVEDGERIDIVFGPPGKELACFVPDGMEWKQINYGQGEGQININGNEWGIYYSVNGGISIILHDGEVDYSEALALVEKIKNKVFGERTVKIEHRSE